MSDESQIVTFTFDGSACTPVVLAPTDWRIAVEMSWLNVDARVGVACVRIWAHAARRSYSTEILVGPDGHHVLNGIGFADGIMIGAAGAEWTKDHPFTLTDATDIAMEAARCRCDRIERAYVEQ